MNGLRFADLEEVRLAYRVFGDGPGTVVLLHGWPQTGLCWRHVAPSLAERWTVVVPDLRGYGASGLGASYDKRAMAADMHQLVGALEVERVFVAGHDRGGRVAHRWALDHPADMAALALLDVLPTAEVLRTLDLTAAKGAWHWLFHLQPELPELLLDGRIEPYLATFFRHARSINVIDDVTFAEYVAAFSDPARLHASLEDYRAQFDADIELDEADHEAGLRITVPLLALWGSDGGLGSKDVVGVWQRFAAAGVRGEAVARCRHYLPEEKPREVVARLSDFFAASGRT